jgi:hypothetical protein
LKNKIYVVCLSTDGKLFIFNIFKCEKIFETNLKPDYIQNYESLLDTIKRYDRITFKSWCQIDIKIGVISITINKNMLNIEVPLFDYDYYEKIIEATSSFKKFLSENIQFIVDESSTSTSNTNSMNFRNNNNQINCSSSIQNNTMHSNNSEKDEKYKNNQIPIDNKIKSSSTSNEFRKKNMNSNNNSIYSINNSNENQLINIGCLFIKSIFSTYVNDIFLEIRDFIGKNFVDKTGILRKSYIEEIKNKINWYSQYKMNIDQDIFLYYIEDDNLKHATYLRDFINFIKHINIINEILPIDRVKYLLK